MLGSRRPGNRWNVPWKGVRAPRCGVAIAKLDRIEAELERATAAQTVVTSG